MPSPAELESACAELRRLEPVFHTPATGPERQKYEPLLAPDFWEIGTSGQRYDRDVVLETLAQREGSKVFEQLVAENFECTALATGYFLVRYALRQGDRLTRRASIWIRRDAGWKILYHQGTVVV